MENTSTANLELIANSYVKYRDVVHGYLRKRLVNDFEAEDLTQDVFIKLVSYKQLIKPETVHFFIFTIAKNISIDYNRRFFKKMEMNKYFMEETDNHTNNTEETISYNELLRIEEKAVHSLSEQCKKVYKLSMHGDYTYREMAEILEISPRTIEKHIMNGRTKVRRYMAAVI
jgi:RNA polymerase sigma-70 factor (ECF subfamily)